MPRSRARSVDPDQLPAATHTHDALPGRHGAGTPLAAIDHLARGTRKWICQPAYRGEEGC